MNEATTSKGSKVTILSDIILNPLRSPAQTGKLSTPPPLVPLVKKKEIGISNTSNVGGACNSNDIQITPSIANSDIATLQTGGVSLKRKSLVVAYQETPKKAKLKAQNYKLITKERVDSNIEETFFNYMTGTYEKVTKEVLKNAESLVKNCDVKDEVTIQKTTLPEKEISINDENGVVTFKEDSQDAIQLVTNSKQDRKLDDKKPTVTIDLTDDDDTETNISIQNNVFIQNVLALQGLLKPDSDTKIPLQNGIIIQNQDTTLHGGVVIKNPSPILQSSLKIGYQNSSNILTPGATSQPLLLMVQNNSPFLVPQGMTSGKCQNSNNLLSNFVLIPNNLNVQTNLVSLVSKTPTVSLQTNKTPFKKMVSSPQITSSNACIIEPKNVAVNLVTTTSSSFNVSPNSTKTTLTHSSNFGPPLLRTLLLSTSENLSKSITNLSQCDNYPEQQSKTLIRSAPNFINSSQNAQISSQNINSSQILKHPGSVNNSIQHVTSYIQNLTNSVENNASLQNFNNFAENLSNALKNFICQTCLHKARSKRDLIVHIYHAHLKGEYELNLRCKLCNFQTDSQSIMEKHDLGHGNGQKNQENEDNICLSNNVEIRIRVAKKKDNNVTEEKSCSVNTDVPIEIIDLSDSNDETPKGVVIFRCFDCNFLTSQKSSLQNHVVRHSGSKFQCSKHVSVIQHCPECNYQNCLSDLEKKMFECKECGYKTCRKQCFNTHVKYRCGIGNDALFSSDSDSEGGHTQMFQCFHCSHITKSLNRLKYHAIQHFGRAFECDTHKSSNSMSCQKCVYELILKDLQHVVNFCQCGFKTLDKKSFLAHTSSKENCQLYKSQDDKGLCSDKYMEYGKLPNDTVANKTNKKTPNRARNVNRNSSAGKIIRKSTTDQLLSSDTETEENSGLFKCFHCTYSTKSRDLLKSHAVKHCDQAFQCNLHPHRTCDNCQNCLYKTMLDELKRKILHCPNCGFKTLRQPTYNRHTSSLENCEKYRKRLAKEEEHSGHESDHEIGEVKNCSPKKKKLPVLNGPVIICAKCNYRANDKEVFKQHEKTHAGKNEFKQKRKALNCFDCNEFCTEDRETLKEHSVAHYKKNFSCDEHPPIKNAPDCGKCIYRLIKNDMESEILICSCSFKTIRKDVYERHKSLNSCKDHKKNLGYDSDDDYVPEHVDTGEKNCSVSNVKKYNLRKFNPVVEIGSDDEKASTRRRTVISKTTSHSFECMKCGLEYTNQAELEEHVKTHRNITFKCKNHSYFNELCKKCLYQYVLEKNSENKMLSCKSCGYTCDNLEAIRTHIKSNVKCESFRKKLNGGAMIKSTHTCYDCNKEFESKTKLWSHATRHENEFHCTDHDDANHKNCNKCMYALILKTIRLNYFRCFDCPDRVFSLELNLKEHVDKMHADAKFKCDVHQANPVESCQKCSYAYIVAPRSKYMYYCAYCSANEFPYATWRTLKTHISNKHRNKEAQCLVHANNKPYLECHKCLYEKVNVCLQFEADNTGYKCWECPLKVFTREQLEGHVKLMHESSTFQCTVHTLGDIDEKCGMCVYENIVVLMNNT